MTRRNISEFAPITMGIVKSGRSSELVGEVLRKADGLVYGTTTYDETEFCDEYNSRNEAVIICEPTLRSEEIIRFLRDRDASLPIAIVVEGVSQREITRSKLKNVLESDSKVVE